MTDISMQDARDETSVDRITLEVIRHQLVSIPNQIERNIERTAFSPLIYEYKDYAVGIVDPQNRLVAQSKGSLPIFVANALGTAVREGLSVLGPNNIGDDDIIITNSAAWLGQHLNNVVAYTPLRNRGELIGFFCVLVHWVDIGGAVPGSCLSPSTPDFVRKDGPSAGVTMATSIASALTRIPVRHNVAMTGEITLRGRVMPIGGLKEKLLAAHRGGLTTVLIPKDNRKDLKDVPKRVLKQLRVVLVDHMDDVLREALAVDDPARMFGARRLAMEYRGGHFYEGQSEVGRPTAPPIAPTPAQPGITTQ